MGQIKKTPRSWHKKVNCISRPCVKPPPQSKRSAHNAVRDTAKRFTVAQLRIEEGWARKRTGKLWFFRNYTCLCSFNQYYWLELDARADKLKNGGKVEKATHVKCHTFAALGKLADKRGPPISCTRCHKFLLKAISFVCLYREIYTWYSLIFDLLFFILFVSMVHRAKCSPSSAKEQLHLSNMAFFTFTSLRLGLFWASNSRSFLLTDISKLICSSLKLKPHFGFIHGWSRIYCTVGLFSPSNENRLSMRSLKSFERF